MQVVSGYVRMHECVYMHECVRTCRLANVSVCVSQKLETGFYVIDSDLQLRSLQERRHPSTHTHPLSAGVIDGYASPFGKSEEWKSLAALHSLSLQIYPFPSLSLRREPDPFVFCTLFALKSHHGSMQSNEPTQPERKAGGKTGRQRGG